MSINKLICFTRSFDWLTGIVKQDYNKQKVHSENYHDKTKQTSATDQLESGIRKLFLQQMQPVEIFMTIWDIIRDNAAVNPRGRAGLRGYVHWFGEINW
jgi:hypothetical protein